jgi:ATP-dependent RNA helicase DDX35
MLSLFLLRSLCFLHFFLTVYSLEFRFSLGAIDEHCKLTQPIGATLAEFPVEPRVARMLIAAGELGCSEEVLSIAALLAVQNVFHAPKGERRGAADAARRKFAVAEGDHLTLLNVYNSFVANQRNAAWCNDMFLNRRALARAVEIRAQLRRYCRQFAIPLVSCADGDSAAAASAPVKIRKAVVSGFFANAAQLQPGGYYRAVRGGAGQLHLHPSSVLMQAMPDWIVFHEVVTTAKHFIHDASAMEPMWLCELAPQFYEFKSNFVQAPTAPRGSTAAAAAAAAAAIGAESVEAASGAFAGAASGSGQPPPSKQRRLGGWV